MTKRHSARHSAPPSLDELVEKMKLRKNDVVCGRGCGTVKKRDGNVRFHQLIQSYFPKYESAVNGTDGKKVVCQQVVDQIRDKKGRFFRLDVSTGEFEQLSYQRAMEKAAQAFRDARGKHNNNATSSSNTNATKVTINDNDVICGRGVGRLSNSKGNYEYHLLIQTLSPTYHSKDSNVGMNDKRAICQKVVDEIAKRKGRFFKYDSKNETYDELDYTRAVDKTAQTFRDTKEKYAGEKAALSPGKSLGELTKSPFIVEATRATPKIKKILKEGAKKKSPIKLDRGKGVKGSWFQTINESSKAIVKKKEIVKKEAEKKSPSKEERRKGVKGTWFKTSGESSKAILMEKKKLTPNNGSKTKRQEECSKRKMESTASRKLPQQLNNEPVGESSNKKHTTIHDNHSLSSLDQQQSPRVLMEASSAPPIKRKRGGILGKKRGPYKKRKKEMEGENLVMNNDSLLSQLETAQQNNKAMYLHRGGSVVLTTAPRKVADGNNPCLNMDRSTQFSLKTQALYTPQAHGHPELEAKLRPLIQTYAMSTCATPQDLYW